MKKLYFKQKINLLSKTVIYTVFGTGALFSGSAMAQSKYVTGDFHQHSTFTDGSWTLQHVFEKNNYYGLDWWANSEHGGGFNRDGRKSGKDLNATVYWDQDTTIKILGTVSMSSGHQNMWRWQSLRDFSFPIINGLRSTYPSKLVLQGYEMNVPGHEHGSVLILGDQLKSNSKKRNVNDLAQFEYMFDNSDKDMIGGLAEGWTKSTAVGHAKTIEAAKWLQENHNYSSWLIPAHPERQRTYTIAHFREMNDVAPDVCFGFESMPGHQKDANRGGYSTSAFGGTFGGCGFFSAKVGGLWDAMLSEGRQYWLFASSDFHDIDGDFYPGEYQKTYTSVSKVKNFQYLFDGLRSGDNWVVTGDLIDNLHFVATNDKEFMSMGSTLCLSEGESLKLLIKVRDPQGTNFNTYSSYNAPVLDHIDLIAGYVHSKYTPDMPEYYVDQVSTTSVIARFDANGGNTDMNGLTSIKWTKKKNGWIEIVYEIKNVDKDMFFRLRGTNHGLNVSNETDGAGNPLPDALMGSNNAAKAFADLWFYSNPVFVKAPASNSIFKSADSENFARITSSQDFKIYPNPASNLINIKNEGKENLEVVVYDLAGKALKVMNSSDHVVSVNIQDLSAGLYIITVKTGDTIKSFKIEKN